MAQWKAIQLYGVGDAPNGIVAKHVAGITH